jgi:hypothetical protein
MRTLHHYCKATLRCNATLHYTRRLLCTSSYNVYTLSCNAMPTRPLTVSVPSLLKAVEKEESDALPDCGRQPAVGGEGSACQPIRRYIGLASLSVALSSTLCPKMVWIFHDPLAKKNTQNLGLNILMMGMGRRLLSIALSVAYVITASVTGAITRAKPSLWT